MVNLPARKDPTSAREYNGRIASIPAVTRVLTTYGTELIAIDSRASISSLMRMAPICAVEPAPIVADNPIPAMTGAAIRTLMNAEKKPVSASTPMLPNELKP